VYTQASVGWDVQTTSAEESYGSTLKIGYQAAFPFFILWAVNKVVATLPGGDYAHAHEISDSRRC
jgi:hypothetical protein